MKTAEEVLRGQVSEGIQKVRMQLTDAQTTFQKLAGADLERIDKETLPVLAESVAKMSQSQFLHNLVMVGMILDEIVKDRD